MSFLPEARVSDSFGPFELLRQHLGFVPNIFRAQTLVPRVIDAQADITAAVLLAAGALTRTQKELILLSVASMHRNSYCVTAHCHVLRAMGISEERVTRIVRDHRTADLSTADNALLDFSITLGCDPTFIVREDIDTLRRRGFSDQQILEAVLVTSLAVFLCALSTGLGVSPDFSPALDSFAPRPAAARDTLPGHAGPIPGAGSEPRGYLHADPLEPDQFPPFAFFEEKFGFVPNIFRAQTLRPDVVAAEARAVGAILLNEDVLSRRRKEEILLVVSAANLNTYCVAVHCEMLSALGVPLEVADQIALDHHGAGLPPDDVALLDFALKLARRPSEYRVGDVEELRSRGFTNEQILEAIVMTGLTCFLNTLQMGLGAVPDFPVRRVFRRASAMREQRIEDPDAEIVRRAIAGDIDAFEILVRRHHGRICRILASVTGDLRDAEECTQAAFMTALDQLPEFRGTISFGAWLTQIGVREGLGCLRRRRGSGTSDDEAPDGGEFHPVRAGRWAEPEAVYSREELRDLVDGKIRELPERFRLVILLKDAEGLSTQEITDALGLDPLTVRKRLHHARMMLREALAPHFLRDTAGGLHE